MAAATRFSALECKICIREYSPADEDHVPVLLPNCGHTVCRQCATRLWSDRRIVCPFDRSESQVQELRELRRNFSILELLEEVNGGPQVIRNPEPVPEELVENGNPNDEDLDLQLAIQLHLQLNAGEDIGGDTDNYEDDEEEEDHQEVPVIHEDYDDVQIIELEGSEDSDEEAEEDEEEEAEEEEDQSSDDDVEEAVDASVRVLAWFLNRGY